MGNQGNFRRTGNYNRAGERINTNRKPFRSNDGQRHQNKNSAKKEADSKAKPVQDSNQEHEGTEQSTEKSENQEEQKNVNPKTRYDDINPQYLKCHICNKSMWDGRSFENHLVGRAHAIMMQKTAESYALTADTMRQELKIREMRRTRKSGHQPPQDFYCAMCDMYAEDGSMHRTTVGHRKLKKYLHPSCNICHKEVPTRIELDEHRLTAEHFKKLQDNNEVTNKPKPEVMVISTLSMEQSYLRDDRERWRRTGRQDDKDKEMEDVEKVEKKDDQDGGEEKKETDNETEGNTEVATEKEKEGDDAVIDNEDTILDYKDGDDLSNVTPDKIPVYSTERGVGRSFLSEFRCVQCRLCRKLLDSEETAEVHLKTWRHYQLFLRTINSKQPAQAVNKRIVKEEDSSDNCKRHKTSCDEDNANDDCKMEVDQQNGVQPAQSTAQEDKANDDNERKVFDEDLNAGDDDLEDWEQSLEEVLNSEAEYDENKEKSDQDSAVELEKKE